MRRVLYVIAASESDGPSVGRPLSRTELTQVYAETDEEAQAVAEQWWQQEHPELPYLKVMRRPQGFQAGFARFSGFAPNGEL